MENLIDDLYEIIKDYRSDEGLMSKEVILNWVEQFDEGDRSFLLEEMKNILKKRYISKDKATELISEMIKFLANHFEEETPQKLILSSYFIDVQPQGKSQKELLAFVDNIVKEEYGLTINREDLNTAKYYIYIDDLLCTGDTLFKNLGIKDKGWLNQTTNGKSHFDICKEKDAKLVLSYFAIHKYNIKKALSRIYYGLDEREIEYTYAWDQDYAIENDIFDPKSKLNFVFPKEIVKDQNVILCQNQIEAKIKAAGYHKEQSVKYRDSSNPITEEFYSSSDNRERFEKIILDKGIEIYNSSENLKSKLRPRPLGYGLNTELSLGFGALIFTWRNVPFNVPLVFWYKSKYWKPLFERKYISYED